MARVGLTGERLARAGAELADEVGFEQVTVSALARRFGVQVASLYSHVRSSDDLKARIATVALTELADQTAAALTAFTIVACPPDRRADRKRAVVAGAMAAIAWFPSALVLTRGFVVSTDYGAWPLLALTLTGLVCYARPAGLRTLAAVAAASPLFLVHAAISL